MIYTHTHNVLKRFEGPELKFKKKKLYFYEINEINIKRCNQRWTNKADPRRFSSINVTTSPM